MYRTLFSQQLVRQLAIRADHVRKKKILTDMSVKALEQTLLHVLQRGRLDCNNPRGRLRLGDRDNLNGYLVLGFAIIYRIGHILAVKARRWEEKALKIESLS